MPKAKKILSTSTTASKMASKSASQYYLPAITGLLIVSSFFLGRLSAQVEYLKKGTTPTAVPSAAAPTNNAPTATKIDVPGLKAMAQKIGGIDMNKFNSCLDNGKYADKIKKDSTYGGTLGVSGTPSFFINGILIVGALPQTEFEKVIDAELKDGTGDKVGVSEAGARKTVDAGTYFTGTKNAKIRLVEFTDFECPYCVRAFPTIEAIMKKYAGNISLEYHSYPLPFHNYAQKAAESAECAGEQGKFWEMHNEIFGAQQ